MHYYTSDESELYDIEKSGRGAGLTGRAYPDDSARNIDIEEQYLTGEVTYVSMSLDSML